MHASFLYCRVSTITDSKTEEFKELDQPLKQQPVLKKIHVVYENPTLSVYYHTAILNKWQMQYFV